MAWNTVHKVNSRTRIGLETTFGTTATTMKDIVLDGPQLPLGKATRRVIENADQRRYRRRAIKPVRGLLAESPLEFKVMLKRLVTRLNAAATPSMRALSARIAATSALTLTTRPALSA